MSLVYVFLVISLITSKTLSAPANIFNIYSSPDFHEQKSTTFPPTYKHPTFEVNVTDKKCNVELVAFSVGRTTGFAASKTSRIAMDHVYYNKEGHFDTATSEFTAPVDGVYEFSFGATSANGKPILLYFYVKSNGQNKPVASTFNYHTGAPSYKQASTVVYVELKRGDRASLWLYSSMEIYGQKGAVTTHFSGHLIK